MILLRKFLIGFFFLPGIVLHAQNTTRDFIGPMQPDSLVLLVSQLDSGEISWLNDSYASLPTRTTLFHVYASNDPSLTGKTIEVRILQVNRHEPALPFHKGWTGQIKVTRNWTRFSPFLFYWFDGFPKETEKLFYPRENDPAIITKPFLQPSRYIRLYVEIPDSTVFPMPFIWINPEPGKRFDPPMCRFKVLAGSEALNESVNDEFFESGTIEVFVTNVYRFKSLLQKSWKGVIFVNYECYDNPPSCGYYLKAIE